MKPDWKDAPKWARYFGMDEDGTWYWYENEPFLGSGGQWIGKGKFVRVAQEYCWEDTLEERPKEDCLDEA